MTTVRQLLRIKGNNVWTVSPDTTTGEAMRILAEKNIGAIMVLDGEEVAGIISERDFVRQVAQQGICNINLPVKDIMTHTVYFVGLDETIEAVMQLMTERHIRHLPVMEKNKLLGIISIGDVVKEVISGQESMIRSLENYIVGHDYAR
jgi:CBS domain-containing protein